MRVKTDWSLPREDGLGDPFEGVKPVEQVGLQVSLDDESLLHSRLIDLMESEAALDERGVTCPLKADSRSSCSACPVAQDKGRLAPLCAIGKEQEAVTMRLLALKHGRAG